MALVGRQVSTCLERRVPISSRVDQIGMVFSRASEYSVSFGRLADDGTAGQEDNPIS